MTVDLLAPLFLIKGSPGVVGYIILAAFVLLVVVGIASNRTKK